MITLLPDQEIMITLLRQALAKHRSVLLCAPTGSGKTTMSSYILSGVHTRGKSANFCVHRRQLVPQVSRELNKQDVPHGYIAAKYPASNQLINVAMQQTYVRKPRAEADLIIVDEAHLNVDVYKKIIDANPTAKVILLSATPERLSGQPIPADVKIETVDTAMLIAAGRLSKFKYYAPTKLDFLKAKQRGGDYAEDAVDAIAGKSTIIGDSIAEYTKLGAGKKFINFSYSVKHSIRTAEAFTAAGYPCAHVDAETSDDERNDVFAKLDSGELLGVSNCGLFCEGMDYPSMEVCIIQKPTASLMRQRQIVGRVLRKSEGKDYAIILDMVNNYRKHNLPDDKHEWRWQGFTKQKKKKGEELPEAYYTCLNCHSTFRIQLTHCPECKHERQKTEREVKEEQGVLEEIKRNEIKKNQKLEEWNCKTLEDWLKLAEQRGNKPTWAQIRHAHRQKRNSNQR